MNQDKFNFLVILYISISTFIAYTLTILSKFLPVQIQQYHAFLDILNNFDLSMLFDINNIITYIKIQIDISGYFFFPFVAWYIFSIFSFLKIFNPVQAYSSGKSNGSKYLPSSLSQLYAFRYSLSSLIFPLYISAVLPGLLFFVTYLLFLFSPVNMMSLRYFSPLYLISFSFFTIQFSYFVRFKNSFLFILTVPLILFSILFFHYSTTQSDVLTLVNYRPDYAICSDSLRNTYFSRTAMASYWTGRPVELFSSNEMNIIHVDSNFDFYYWINSSNDRHLKPVSEPYFFVFLQGLSIASVIDKLGDPVATYQCRAGKIFVYDTESFPEL